MPWGWGGVGTGRGVCHGTPWDVSKFHGNHKKTQHLIGHCTVRVKICHCFPTNWSYVSFDGVISLQSWVFFSFLNFLFCIGVQPAHNIMIVSGEQQRNEPYTCMYLFPPKPPSWAEFHMLYSSFLLAVHFKQSSHTILLTWYGFSTFAFKLSVSLYLKWVSCIQQYSQFLIFLDHLFIGVAGLIVSH